MLDYINDIKKARPLIDNALQQAKRYCNNYLIAKEDLAYLAYFRNKIKFDQHTSEAFKQNSGIVMMTEESTKLLNEDEEEKKSQLTVMNLFLCTKYANAGKLSSHNWFFNGFCK